MSVIIHASTVELPSVHGHPFLRMLRESEAPNSVPPASAKRGPTKPLFEFLLVILGMVVCECVVLDLSNSGLKACFCLLYSEAGIREVVLDPGQRSNTRFGSLESHLVPTRGRWMALALTTQCALLRVLRYGHVLSNEGCIRGKSGGPGAPVFPR